MPKLTPTPMEVDSLKQLKVIRNDNPILQAVLDNYIKMTMDLASYKSNYNELAKINIEFADANYKLEEELNHARKHNQKVEKTNAVLRSNLRQFLHNLEGQGIIAMKEDGSYDTAI